MRKPVSRGVIYVVAASVLAASLVQTGCGKKPNASSEGQAITVDSPWYTVRQLDLSADIDLEAYSYPSVRLIGCSDDGIFLEFSGTPVTGTDTGPIGVANNVKTMVIRYGFDGELLSSSCIDDALDEAFPETISPYRYINTVSFEMNRINLNLTVTDPVAFDSCDYDVSFDPVTLEFGELAQSNSGVLGANIYSYLDTDGYSVVSIETWDLVGNTMECLKVTTPDGDITYIAPKDFIPDIGEAVCTSLYLLEPHKVLVRLESLDITYAVLDLDTMTISPYTGDTSVLKMWEGRYIEGIGNLSITGDSINLIDINAGTSELYFDYNCCNINRSYAPYLSLEYLTPDKMVLSGYTMHNNDYVFNVDDLKILILEKQDSNPNAGKQIISVAAPLGITFAVAESICAFNERSDTHYMIIDSRYNYDNIDTGNVIGVNSSDAVYNRLAIDLMAGDGPDLLFDVSGYSQLCNDDYLMDLSDIELPSDVFANVIDSVRTGDKLYNIPILFYPNGILVNSDVVDPDQVGFTFDQYDSFVDTVCNGVDPVALPRLEFFTACLSQLGAESGPSSEEFWQLAEYARDGYNEPVDAYDEEEFDPWAMAMETVDADLDAYYILIHSFSDMLDGCGGNINGKILLGLPSTDGRGPQIEIASSIAISASTSNAQTCKEFISLLLSPDVQNTFCYTDGNPISRSALEHQIGETVESYNEYRQALLRWTSPSGLSDMGISAEELVSEDCISIYENIIDSCRGTVGIDSEERMVINEEMAAYFAGQKTPAEISELISDRIQTIRDERQ